MSSLVTSYYLNSPLEQTHTQTTTPWTETHLQNRKQMPRHTYSEYKQAYLGLLYADYIV